MDYLLLMLLCNWSIDYQSLCIRFKVIHKSLIALVHEIPKRKWVDYYFCCLYIATVCMSYSIYSCGVFGEWSNGVTGG